MRTSPPKNSHNSVGKGNLAFIAYDNRVKRLIIVFAGWVTAVALAAVYTLIGRFADDAFSGQHSRPVFYAWLAVAVIIAGISAWFVPWWAARSQGNEEKRLRRSVVAHIFDLGPARRSAEQSGRVVNTATDGVERAGAYRAGFIGPMIASMTAPLAVLAWVAIFVDAFVAAWLVLALPLIPLALGGFQRMFRSVSQRYRANARVLSATFLDAIQGLGTLRLHNAGGTAGRKLAQASEELRQHVMKLLAGNQLVLFIVDSVFSLTMVTLAAVLAIAQLSNGSISPGEALSIVLISTLLLEPVDRIGQFFYIGMGGMAAVKEIDAFIQTRAPVPHGAGETAEPNSAWSVEVSGLSFAYDSGPLILDDVSFSIAAGEKVALVGPSGGGKSTVVALLQRFVEPDAGTIRLAGVDVATVEPQWSRDQVAVVAQRTFLFTGSLRDNLVLAKPGATDDELYAALASANLADDVRSWPDQLNTSVGERGLSLSGGQAQRLAIARAVLKDSPVLILDEPTAHVDLASERAILDALANLMRERTVLTISHRPHTIRTADRVLLLSEGTITTATGAVA